MDAPTTNVIPMEEILPPVRIAIGAEERRLRDTPLVRSAIDLLTVLDCNDAEGLGPESLREAAEALQRFARALLGPHATAEVVQGWVYVGMLHLVHGRAK